MIQLCHGCLPQAKNRNTEGSNSAFNRKIKIQDGRRRVKKEEARKKVIFVLNSFPLSRGDLTWDFHESNPYYHIIHISKNIIVYLHSNMKNIHISKGHLLNDFQTFRYHARGLMWDSCCGTIRVIVYQNILNDMHWNPVLLF